MPIKEKIIAQLKKPQIWLPFLLLLAAAALFFITNYIIGRSQSEQAAVGTLRYDNKDLGFYFDLPKEFEYFQTQRVEKDTYTDLEIFVPTSDRIYTPQEVPSYGKIIVIRVYQRKAWEALPQDSQDRKTFGYQGIKNDRVYAIKFWDSPPADWESKWNKAMRDMIIKGFHME